MPSSSPPLPLPHHHGHHGHHHHHYHDISLSLEETQQLAGLARRKSNDRLVREDLRLRLAHNNFLDSLLRDIAKRSPPPSPVQRSARPVAAGAAAATAAGDRSSSAEADHHHHHHKGRTIQWATQIVSKVEHVEDCELDEYNDDDDDSEEDLAGLSLCRMSSRPVR